MNHKIPLAERNVPDAAALGARPYSPSAVGFSNSGTAYGKSGVLLFFACLLVFRLALDYAYGAFVNIQYELDFLPMRLKVDLGQYWLSLGLFLLSSASIRPYQHSASNIFQLMACLFVVAPLTSQFGLDSDRPMEPVLATIAAFFVAKLVSELHLFNSSKRPGMSQGRYLATVTAIGGIVYLVVWSVVSGAIANFNLQPELVYEFRDKSSSLLDLGVLAYLNLWIFNTFTIYLVCVSLEKKHYYLLVPLLALQTYFGGVTNHKGVVFMPLLAIGFWYFLARTKKLYPLPLALALLILVSIGVFYIWDDGLLAGIVVRRTFYVPSGLTFAWFDFFDHQPFVFWSDSVLARFVDTKYSGGAKIPFVVGDYLFPNNELAANNGMVSAGYAHAGYAGILLYSVILGIILNGINHMARTGVPLWMATALTIVPLRGAISDTDLPTAILSHGIMISMIFLWLYRRNPAALKPQPMRGWPTQLAAPSSEVWRIRR
jgi:hypothetical protein